MTQICFKSCHYHLSRSCQSKPSAARIIQKSDPRGLSIYKVKELSPLKPPLDLPTNLITWSTLMHMHMGYVTRFDFHEVHVTVNTTLAGKNQSTNISNLLKESTVLGSYFIPEAHCGKIIFEGAFLFSITISIYYFFTS